MDVRGCVCELWDMDEKFYNLHGLEEYTLVPPV